MECRILKSGKCEITQWYNETHGGCDLVGGGYTLDHIVAHSDGIVVACRNNCNKVYSSEQQAINEWGDSYGNFVLLKHSDSCYTMYAHMSYGTVGVTKGQSVKRGQVIGYMGNTGNTSGGHLHFEYRTSESWTTRKNCMYYINGDLPLVTVPKPVEENKEVKQLKVNYANTMRVRSGHSTNDSIIGFCPVGYYNIIETYKDNNYTWVMVETNKWVAVIPPNCEIVEPIANEPVEDSTEQTIEEPIVEPVNDAVIKNDERVNLIVELINYIIKWLKNVFKRG